MMVLWFQSLKICMHNLIHFSAFVQDGNVQKKVGCGELWGNVGIIYNWKTKAITIDMGK